MILDSILTSIKKMLGIVEEYTHFDSDLIIHINSVLAIANQLGVGPINGFRIEDKEDKWSDFIQDVKNIEFVKTYVFMKVRLLFDPPSSSSLIEAIKQTISELEWRILISEEENQNE